ncbi:MAG TPA: thioredoxin domain-containing protein [Flavobacteriales bacterium]
MKKIIPVFTTMVVLTLASCANSTSQKQVKYSLLPQEFEEKLKSLPKATIIDVRTPKEFAEGSIEGAKNINWQDAAFAEQIQSLDKNKPVFVYCLVGGRSGEAAALMRQQGFTEVYELEGGMMKWNAAGMPIHNASSEGMTKADFDRLIQNEKLVLVDFYADWCGPCKKMKPYLEEIARDMKDVVVVERIDVDANKALCREMGVSALPVLMLYKNGEVVWMKNALAEKAEMVAAIAAAKQ